MNSPTVEDPRPTLALGARLANDGAFSFGHSKGIVMHQEDPVLRSARREAVVVFVTWIAALAYTVTYCTLNGYGRPMEDLRFVMGFPDWVFWGVLAPWSACFLVAFWFSHVFMTDEDLGDEVDENDTPCRADEETAQ
jgi:hypothetical protein